ncbi:helix-turn-helix domain-containing protein [Ruminococcus sp.]|uniref:helix-turn-helix domain-containing protein n=1 Tax=Ruminococcus sp. TaxID=41978 RepID=UPI00388FF9E6
MDKKNTADIIKELRTNEKLTQTELGTQLANILGIKEVRQDDISRYEHGSELSIALLKAYSKRFHVSTDYLLGLTNTATTDKDTRVICDYTGLSEKAVEELHTLTEIYEYIDLSSKLKSAWICEGIRGYASVLNDFIEKGYLRVIIGLATDYYQSMDITIDMCKELISELEEVTELNRRKQNTDNNRFDTLALTEILDNRKEIRLHYYEAQDQIRDFFKSYQKKIIDEYYHTIEEYDDVLSEYERVLEENEDGENNGNNQETE